LANDGRTVILIDNRDGLLRTWSLKTTLVELNVSDNCTTAVGRAVAKPEVFLFSETVTDPTYLSLTCAVPPKDGSSESAEPGTQVSQGPTPRGFVAAYLSTDHSRLYVRFEDVVCVRRMYAGPAETRVLTTDRHETTLVEKGLAFVERSRKGVRLYREDHDDIVDLWPDIDFINVYQALERKVLLAVPTSQNGIYLARSDGTVGQVPAGLTHVDVTAIEKGFGSEYLWVWAGRRLYAARLSIDQKGLPTLAALRKGEPVTGQFGSPKNVWKLWVVGDGATIWLHSDDRANIREAPANLWKGSVVKDDVRWQEVDPELWGHRPILFTMVEYRRTDVARIRTDAQEVFDISLGSADRPSVRRIEALSGRDVTGIRSTAGDGLWWVYAGGVWRIVPPVPGVTTRMFAAVWDRPALRAFLLLSTALVVCVVLLPESRLRRVSPLVMLGLGPAVTMYPGTTFGPLFGDMTLTDAAIAYSCLAVASAVAALASPAAFQALSQLVPFQVVTPLLLNSNTLRRRVFRGYVDDARRRIAAERRPLSDDPLLAEHYCALPFRVRKDDTWVAMEADDLAQLIAQARGVTYLLTGPAGTGKSALMRELTLKLLDIFERRGGALPVAVASYASLDETVIGRVERGLGPHRLPRSHLELLLRSGNLVVLIDGLTEGDEGPERWSDFVRTEDGQNTSLVAALRPSEEFQRALHLARPMCVLLEPPSLNEDEALRRFCRAYGEEGDALERQLPYIRSVAGTATGELVPLFVKIALVVARDRPDDLPSGAATAMRDFAEHLFASGAPTADRRAQLRARAVLLARESYWRYGSRTVRPHLVSSINDEDVDALLRLGVLVRRGTTDEILFWHDTMQSFLAAEALAERWSGSDAAFLVRANNLDLFRRNPAAFLRDGVNVASEMFQCCLWTAPDIEAARQLLHDTISAWVEKLDHLFATNDVTSGLVGHVSSETIGELQRQRPREAMREALRLAQQLDEATTFPLVSARLFAALSRRVYEQQPQVFGRP
jgi:hypothetical protein